MTNLGELLTPVYLLISVFAEPFLIGNLISLITEQVGCPLMNEMRTAVSTIYRLTQVTGLLARMRILYTCLF